MTMESDEALFERLRNGDITAFDRLHERHARALFGFVRAHLRDPHEAEDVLHDAFLAILRERDIGHEVTSFRAWLYGVARNLCLNRARSRKRADSTMQAAAHVQQQQPPPPHAEESLQQFEQTAALRAAVEKLPPALAEVYRLRAAGLSYEELADVLAIPLGTVRSRIHDMVKRLQMEMQHAMQ
jgi:RNA polymerase sigma-70 factor (ECF subfamily)